MKKVIEALLILTLLVAPVEATAVSIHIWNTSTGSVFRNDTYGANNTVSVNAWNNSYVKNWSVGVVNKSDTISFNISNVTAYQVVELKVNGTSINAYQAGANGMVNFTYIQEETSGNGNKTYTLAPAVKANGYNMTWLWLANNGLVNTTQFNMFQDCSGKIAVNTVYQNTNTTNMFFNINFNGVDIVHAYSNAANPPTVEVAETYPANTVYSNLIFYVFPGNYWKIENVDTVQGCYSWQ